MDLVNGRPAEERELVSVGHTGGAGHLFFFFFYPESARVKCQAFLREAAP